MWSNQLFVHVHVLFIVMASLLIEKGSILITINFLENEENGFKVQQSLICFICSPTSFDYER